MLSFIFPEGDHQRNLKVRSKLTLATNIYIYNKSGQYYFDTRLSRATCPSPLFSAVTGPAYVIFSTAGVRRRNEIESKVTKRSPFCAAVEIRWEASREEREARQQVEARKVLSKWEKRKRGTLPALLTSGGSGREGNGTLFLSRLSPNKLATWWWMAQNHRTPAGVYVYCYLILNLKVN